MSLSETEKAYRNLLGESNTMRTPMSRKEKLLHKMLGEDIEIDPPQSREEDLLLQIIEQGGGGGGSGSSVAVINFTASGGFDETINGVHLTSDKTYNEILEIVSSPDNLWIADIEIDPEEPHFRSCSSSPSTDIEGNVTGINMMSIDAGVMVVVRVTSTDMFITQYDPNQSPSGDDVGGDFS